MPPPPWPIPGYAPAFFNFTPSQFFFRSVLQCTCYRFIARCALSERGCVVELAPWDFATECISGGFHPSFVIHSVICITFLLDFSTSPLHNLESVQYLLLRGNESQGAIFLVHFCTLIKSWLQVWIFNYPNIGWFSPRVCNGVGFK